MKVGAIVAAAAAKHLTPVTLEVSLFFLRQHSFTMVLHHQLGGKCPVIIDSHYDMELAARRILWGKMINVGQVCISPDYVLVSREKQDSLIAGLDKACVTSFYSAIYPLPLLYQVYPILTSNKLMFFACSVGMTFSQTVPFRRPTSAASSTNGTFAESMTCWRVPRDRSFSAGRLTPPRKRWM